LSNHAHQRIGDRCRPRHPTPSMRNPAQAWQTMSHALRPACLVTPKNAPFGQDTRAAAPPSNPGWCHRECVAGSRSLRHGRPEAAQRVAPGNQSGGKQKTFSTRASVHEGLPRTVKAGGASAGQSPLVDTGSSTRLRISTGRSERWTVQNPEGINTTD